MPSVCRSAPIATRCVQATVSVSVVRHVTHFKEPLFKVTAHHALLPFPPYWNVFHHVLVIHTREDSVNDKGYDGTEKPGQTATLDGCHSFGIQHLLFILLIVLVLRLCGLLVTGTVVLRIRIVQGKRARWLVCRMSSGRLVHWIRKSRVVYRLTLCGQLFSQSSNRGASHAWNRSSECHRTTERPPVSPGPEVETYPQAPCVWLSRSHRRHKGNVQ
mmetsp:Transcript_27982/g.73797  ORF Transcript_27982/g.73797 Transcript_27982/m.73797 type:complete len:216 (-) Transcript_27982:55-702(-)